MLRAGRRLLAALLATGTTDLSLFSDTGFTVLEGTVFTRSRDIEEANYG